MNNIPFIVKLPMVAVMICGTLLITFVYLDMLTKGRFPVLEKAADLSCYTGVAFGIFLFVLATVSLLM
jgi:hypothetical protein